MVDEDACKGNIEIPIESAGSRTEAEKQAAADALLREEGRRLDDAHHAASSARGCGTNDKDITKLLGGDAA